MACFQAADEVKSSNVAHFKIRIILIAKDHAKLLIELEMSINSPL